MSVDNMNHILAKLQSPSQASKATETSGTTLILLHTLFNSLMEVKGSNDKTVQLQGTLRNPAILRILRNKTIFPHSLSPLHTCIRQNLVVEIKLILEAGANVEVVEVGSDITPTGLAIQMGRVTILGMLTASGSNVKRYLEKKDTTVHPLIAEKFELVKNGASGEFLDIKSEVKAIEFECACIFI